MEVTGPHIANTITIYFLMQYIYEELITDRSLFRRVQHYSKLSQVDSDDIYIAEHNANSNTM